MSGNRAPRVIYFDHGADPLQPGFRSGEVCRVEPGGESRVVQRVALGPNSLHALHGHGVVEALAGLPLAAGRLEPGREAILRPTAYSLASRILYEADRRTYGGTWEFRVGESADGAREYRLVVDNRDYQRSLSRLQYLVVLASREGHAVRLRL